MLPAKNTASSRASWRFLCVRRLRVIQKMLFWMVGEFPAIAPTSTIAKPSRANSSDGNKTREACRADSNTKETWVRAYFDFFDQPWRLLAPVLLPAVKPITGCSNRERRRDNSPE